MTSLKTTVWAGQKLNSFFFDDHFPSESTHDLSIVVSKENIAEGK
jgi:hypothetical protein